MDDLLFGRMAAQIAACTHFSHLPAKTRPQNTVWDALNAALLNLRMPIYHVQLGKPGPKKGVRELAIQQSLAILAIFGHCVGTHQAILTSHGRYAHSISFQPRPFGMNWTAEHALACENEEAISLGSRVGADDMLHLTWKTACAIAGWQAGAMRPSVTTFHFMAHDQITALVRGAGEHSEFFAELA